MLVLGIGLQFYESRRFNYFFEVLSEVQIVDIRDKEQRVKSLVKLQDSSKP